MDGTGPEKSYMHKQFSGEVVTIKKVIKSGKYFRYTIEEDERKRKWHKSMFEPIGQEKVLTHSTKLPDI